MPEHYFTEEFPDHEYQCTTKNAQLVVYTAKFRDHKRRELDPKCPLDINWQSFGWTDHPTSNPTGMVERRMAWGYSHKATEPKSQVAVEAVGTSYNLTLNALPSRAAFVYVDAKGRVILQTTIDGAPSRLWKIYVKTSNTMAFIPKVMHVDLYGTNIDDDRPTYERIIIST
ncbi:hypothetical protein BBO99_00008960 [Phytophthora kernoviae]|uniref:DUF4833 domain-containing protein n=2 Tax=Phytophthora kernoviae TaxID=325452 RepID=A0A3R7G925_9STRA|nr:hypothetical protein G195_009978 [Phytophthora kernoviae 00238/432]KAG2508005.1 hypothetical protein JM16_008772 [Phytophthora kernoviae]KAG2520052.1 hypothetical protein JM18_007326 [Phytophthora kernoviae]RLN43597.1 hypothetical protein BBI17_008819 [Phytophthora kernoviae]RLN74385.1 hypothetical protein BBO99_00008960 [Phytophthora kernoviae]